MERNQTCVCTKEYYYNFEIQWLSEHAVGEINELLRTRKSVKQYMTPHGEWAYKWVKRLITSSSNRRLRQRGYLTFTLNINDPQHGRHMVSELSLSADNVECLRSVLAETADEDSSNL